MKQSKIPIEITPAPEWEQTLDRMGDYVGRIETAHRPRMAFRDGAAFTAGVIVVYSCFLLLVEAARWLL